MSVIAPDDPAAVLNAAADLIERDGWHQGGNWEGFSAGHPYHPGTPCCPLGAIAAVTNRESGAASPAAKALRQFIIERGQYFIARWNDAPGQTAVNVIATMREAARTTR